MKRTLRELGYAVLASLVPFATSVLIFPLKKSHPPAFDSLMGVALSGTTVVLALLYLRRTPGNPPVTGLRLGITWVAVNWLLDALMFSAGPMKMPLARYLTDIGLAYLMLPVITAGLGAAMTGGRARRFQTGRVAARNPA